MTTTVPKEIAEAIMKVIDQAPRLAKADENRHGKYHYVSIDAYYEAIPSLAIAQGLAWMVRETRAEVVSEKAIHFSYAFDVFHKSGACVMGMSELSILHPIQGAQTAGSAASYAEKLFMRTTFKVVTGEEDADATNPADLKLDRRPERKAEERPRRGEELPESDNRRKTATLAEIPKYEGLPAIGEIREVCEGVFRVNDDAGGDMLMPLFKLVQTQQQWRTIREIFFAFSENAKTTGQLRAMWRENITVLEEMERKQPEMFDEVKAHFVAMRKKLEPKDY